MLLLWIFEWCSRYHPRYYLCFQNLSCMWDVCLRSIFVFFASLMKLTSNLLFLQYFWSIYINNIIFKLNFDNCIFIHKNITYIFKNWLLYFITNKKFLKYARFWCFITLLINQYLFLNLNATGIIINMS